MIELQQSHTPLDKIGAIVFRAPRAFRDAQQQPRL
jgi:hypothetical protein